MDVIKYMIVKKHWKNILIMDIGLFIASSATSDLKTIIIGGLIFSSLHILIYIYLIRN